jgi:hypothetical protein
MTPLDLMRWQMAAAFGMLDLQRRMLSGAWQVGLWCLPPGHRGPLVPSAPEEPQRKAA